MRLSRPYYLCSRCHVGQFPVEVELDIKNREFPPGVRRMHARVGQQASFNHGREQLKVLAGLQVTTKSVERIAEAIGAHTAQCEQKEQSGVFWTMREPTPSWHFAALISMAALRTIEKSVERVGRLDLHFYVARPV